jgi:transposase
MSRSSSTVTSPYAPDLEEVRAWLKKMVAAMKFVELIIAVIALITRMRDINTELTKRLAHLTRKRPRSETLERVERQLVLPLMGLVTGKGRSASKGERKARREGSKAGGGRNGFPANMPRVPVPNPVPADQRICPLCGIEMLPGGHTTCERLNVIPAQVVVEQRMDEWLACPNDDTIVSAAAPPAIVKGGKLGDGLIVETTCDKYLEHQPVERQCERWARSGVEIAPQTLGRAVGAHIDVLRPLAESIVEQTRAPGLLGTDATGIPVLDPGVTEGIRTGAIWCWTNARWVSFFYSPSGDSDSVRRFLGSDLRRTVQCDGTSVTTFIERAGGKRPGCWGHGRRRFVEAARSGDSLALEALRKIAPLFAIERASKLAGDTAEQRRARRLEHSRPVLDDIRAFVDEQRALIPPKTPLGRALGYLHRQWHRLILFLEDGNIELTNNRRERELRRLVQGRKNWLFTWKDIGGERTAAILTVLATCIAHDVNPRAYLHLVTKLIVNGWPSEKMRDLLPDRILTVHPELYIGDSAAAGIVPLLPASVPEA